MATIDFSELFKLSPAERIQLAQDLWDSVLDQPEALPLTAEQCQELDRRLAEHLQNPSTGVSWDEAGARLWARFNG